MINREAQNNVRVDYEVINTALGVEINMALPSATISKVIRARLTEMPREERSVIPDKVMDLIKHIIPASDVPKAKGRKPYRFVEPDTIQLIGKGDQNDKLRAIVGSNHWADWSRRTGATIRQSGDGVIAITSAALRGAEHAAIMLLLSELGL